MLINYVHVVYCNAFYYRFSVKLCKVKSIKEDKIEANENTFCNLDRLSNSKRRESEKNVRKEKWQVSHKRKLNRLIISFLLFNNIKL